MTSSPAVTCTITNTRQTGTLTISKVLSPASDPGRFNLLIDGSSPNAGSNNVGNGGTTGPTSVNTGSHTFGEVAHSGTSLGDYTSSWSCSDGTSGSGTGSSVSVTSSPAVTCTITNTRKTGTLTISGPEPASDPGRFNLQIDGTAQRRLPERR